MKIDFGDEDSIESHFSDDLNIKINENLKRSNEFLKRIEKMSLAKNYKPCPCCGNCIKITVEEAIEVLKKNEVSYLTPAIREILCNKEENKGCLTYLKH